MSKDRPTIVIEKLSTGRALVAEGDPETGGRVVHERIKTRHYEILHEIGVITDDQCTACELFRDNWQDGRLMADARAGGQTRAKGEITDTAAASWARHTMAMKHLGAAKALVIQAVVLHDEKLVSVGRRVNGPLAVLEHGLDRLVTYCERGHLSRGK